jgi:DisA bacterial checkpoint controller nucleotide-binding
MPIEQPLSRAFPADLAARVEAGWTELVAGDYSPPPLPNLAQLKELFEVSYLVGMETDEARPLKFMLCCSRDHDEIPRRAGGSPIQSWVLAPERLFNIQELRRLAAVTDIDSSAIWIGFADDKSDKLMVRGLVNLGKSWSVARNAFAYHYDELPHALLVRVTAPGRLAIYQSGYRIAALSGGHLELGAFNIPWMDLLGAAPLFEEGQNTLRQLITAPKHEYVGQWHPFETLAYKNCILAILNGMQLAGHGGALILKSQSCGVVESECVRIKYGLTAGGDSLKSHFIEFMNARHRHGDLLWLSEWGKEAAPSEQEITLASFPLGPLQQKVAQVCTFIGSLAGTDGAIVLGTDLIVEGFGTEIVLDKVKPAKAFQVDDPMQRTGLEELDIEQLGMRHRSAIRLCGTDSNLAVFVVSQDGGVSFVWNKDGNVCFKRGIATTNMNMLLA